ncbi:CoA pyrophosphatase, partial [Nocardia elegans]|nr:CoA pyrophosphatase [Nocardia elegans]
HAPTGALLWQFREVVLLGRTATDARVADFLQPDWTHR